MSKKDKRAYEYLPASVRGVSGASEVHGDDGRGVQGVPRPRQDFGIAPFTPDKVTMNAKACLTTRAGAPSDNRFCRRIRSSEEDASAGQAVPVPARGGRGARREIPLCRRSGLRRFSCGRTLGACSAYCCWGVVLPLGSLPPDSREGAAKNIRLEAVEKAPRQLSGGRSYAHKKNGTGHKLKLESASLTGYYAGGKS